MTPSELQRIVTLAGHNSRVARDEVLVETCYFCGNTRWNLELSADKGVYHCWACRAGGRVDVFLSGLTGEVYSIPVAARSARFGGPRESEVSQEFTTIPVGESALAARYLMRRGIDEYTARGYGMAVCNEKGHRLYSRLVIPAREYWTGAVVGWVGRTYTRQHPKYLSTVPRQTICGWRVSAADAACVFVEGALDGIAVHRAGYHAAVLMGLSTQDAPLFVGRLPGHVIVVVMLDGAAYAAARRLYWTIKAVHRNTVFVLLDAHQDPADLGPQGVREKLSAIRNDTQGYL